MSTLTTLDLDALEREAERRLNGVFNMSVETGPWLKDIIHAIRILRALAEPSEAVVEAASEEACDGLTGALLHSFEIQMTHVMRAALAAALRAAEGEAT